MTFYLRICELDLKGQHTAKHIQPIPTDLEDPRAVVLASTGPGETTAKGHATVTQEVRAHMQLHALLKPIDSTRC